MYGKNLLLTFIPWKFVIKANDRCGEAPVISNGTVTVKNGRAKIECKEGYTPVITELSCQSGEWNFDEFTAETICHGESCQLFLKYFYYFV